MDQMGHFCTVSGNSESQLREDTGRKSLHSYGRKIKLMSLSIMGFYQAGRRLDE